MVRCEFQAVILAAGRGSRLTDLTSGTPKCLLPVGGKPVLCHTIRTLEKSDFQDVLIVVLEEELREIQRSLSDHNVKINFELFALPSESEDWGTADSLRYLISQDKIKTDVVLVSCDLFTNASIHKLLFTYRQHRASFAALFFPPLQGRKFQVPGSDRTYKPLETEKDIIGIDSDTSRIMFLASVSDFEENMSISRNILKRHPRLNLRTDLIDGHLYVMSYNLAKYLAAKTVFSSLKGEFFPHVVRKQHYRKKLGNEESSVVNDSEMKSLLDFLKETKLEESIVQKSAYNDHEGDLKEAYHGDALKCYAVISDEDTFGIRVHSLQGLFAANSLCIREESFVGSDMIGTRLHPTASIEAKPGKNKLPWQQCFVGAGTKMKENTNIIQSAIGEGCVINSGTTIQNCLLLRNVTVQEGCQLDNCIVANDVEINERCRLVNCLIGRNSKVPSDTYLHDKVLMMSEDLMEI